MARIFILFFALLAIQSNANGLAEPLNDNNEQRSPKAFKSGASIAETLLKRLERLEEEVGELRKEKAADQAKLKNLEKRVQELESPEFKFKEHKEETLLKSNQGQKRTEISFINEENTEVINFKNVGIAGRAVISQSCRDLAIAGQNVDSIYLIQSPTNLKKIAAVYCAFNSGSPVQTDIGFVDVKTSPAHFYAQRSVPYSKNGTTIAYWQLTRLNIGNAFNSAAGVFTVPKDGVYHFHFSGIKNNSDSPTLIYIRLNGNRVGYSYGTSGATLATISLHSTLKLKKNDTIDLFLEFGVLYDDGNYSSHFTGWLDEEDLEI